MLGRKRRSAVLGPGLLALLLMGSAQAQQSKPTKELPSAPSAAQGGGASPARAPATPQSSAPRDLVSQEGWPREVASGQNVFTVYQPQLESWDGISLEAFAAVSVKTGASENLTYGILWFSARTEVDKDNRLVTLKDIAVNRVRFPSAPGKERAYLTTIQKTIITKTRLLALDRLEAMKAILEAEERATEQEVRNDPPAIFFSQAPALLVYIDGEPAYRPVKGVALERIINTRPLILRGAAGKHYLHLMDGWMESASLEGPWTVAQQVSPELAKAAKDAVASGQVDMLSGQSDPKSPAPSLARVAPPFIQVVNFPAELIVSDGPPKFVPIEGTQLQYAENTTGHVFWNAGDKKTYVLISGRWFSGEAANGPWTYVPGGKLPADFARIPDSSPKENVKASVPGTAQSLEALIADSIPQTAAINRKQARMDPPKFDGTPQWKPIEGTALEYAINTAWPVIRVEANSFYAVENGVWFTARSLAGPWRVADSVPPAIYSIPPSSPLYNITFVKVYRSTPELVFVGYTPGYYGTCVSHGSGPVLVFGTGYQYTPWVGNVWYGPPLTYGYGSALTFTPWTGWAYGFGFGLSAPAPQEAAKEEAAESQAVSTTITYANPPPATSSSNISVSFYYGAYPWWGPYGWGYYYPYPYYYPYYYGGYGVAWGARGAVAWGPGGWAATTGNVYHRWGNTSAVTRSSAGYNAWTGNAWAGQVGASYNSRTGTIAAGQRGAVGNVYTGNYAYGGRGTAYNPNTGQQVSGGRITVGNAGTGQSGSAGWVRGEQGGMARVGDDLYAAKDGTVYRRTDNGWQSNSGSGWNDVQRPDSGRPETTSRGERAGASQQPSRQRSSQTASSMDRQYAARQTGSQRTNNYRSGSYRSAGGFRGGGRRR
jgi:hypothetical protein